MGVVMVVLQLLEMDIDYGGNGMNFTLETAIVTGLTSYAPTIPIRVRVEVLSVQGQVRTSP
jgi:hypothetical protein